MKNIEIKINEDDINEYVTKAIIDSKLGVKIQEHLNKELDNLVGDRWESPVKQIVKDEVKYFIREILYSEENREKIKKSIIKFIEENNIDDLVDRNVNKIMEQFFDKPY